MQVKLAKEQSNVNICALWERVGAKRGTHAHVYEISVWDNSAAMLRLLVFVARVHPSIVRKD